MDPLTKTMRFVITLSAHKHYDEPSTIEVLYELTDRIRTAGADWIRSAVIRDVLKGMIDDLKPADYERYNIADQQVFDMVELYKALVNW